MDLARLTVALFPPWIAGFIWLRAAENRLRPGSPANVFRQLGYGLVLGIEQLAIEGITQGCEPHHYCPLRAVKSELWAFLLISTWTRRSDLLKKRQI